MFCLDIPMVTKVRQNIQNSSTHRPIRSTNGGLKFPLGRSLSLPVNGLLFGIRNVNVISSFLPNYFYRVDIWSRTIL